MVWFKFGCYIGGYLWWVLVRFCKSELKDEQQPEKWVRNLFFLIILGLIVAFIVLKVL